MGSLFGIRTGDGWATIVRPNIFCARGSEAWLNWSLAYVCDENYPAAEVDMEKQAAAIPRCCSPAAVHSGGVHLTSPSWALPIRLLHKMDSVKSSGIGAFGIWDCSCQSFSCTISALIWGLCCITRELTQLPLCLSVHCRDFDFLP